MRAKRKLLSVILITFVLVMNLLVPNVARAEQQTSTRSHAIAVAYDNSGSMYFDYSSGDMGSAIDRWSNAKYSMEVLAAMLGEHDSLVIYTMDQDYPLITLQGSQSLSERVAEVHNTNFGESNTNIDPVMQAIAQLEATEADEKYLIIATDGEFLGDRNGYSTQLGLGLNETVNYYIDQASDDGITTIYLAINSKAPIQEDTSRNIFVKSPDSTQILSTVLEVSNQVFGRAELPQKYWDANTGKVTFDVPMSKVVVIAQGANASLGALSGEVNTAGLQAPVSYSQVGSPETDSIVNERLKGVVGIYDAEMPAGEYKLDISGAESVGIYYMPYLDISVELQRGDGNTMQLSPTEANELYEGEYTAKINLLDPFTGEEIKSPLMDGAVTSLEVENNGTTMELQPGETFELVPGAVSIHAIADVPGGVRVVQQFQTSEIISELRGLVVDTSNVPTQVRYDKPESEDAHPSGTVLVRKEDGSEITPEEWVIMELSYSSPDEMEWELEKSSEVGVFNVTLKSTGKKPNIIEWAMIHLLPHVTGGAHRSTFFTAEVSSTLSNLGGTEKATTSLRGLFMWWIWVILSILGALIWRILTKPRLPRLSPKIDLGDGQGPRPIDGRVQLDSGLLSLLPQRGHFGITAQLVGDEVVQRKVGLPMLYLVAVGRKRFKIAEPSLSALRAMQDAGDEVGCLRANGESETLSAKSSFDIVRSGSYVTIHFR